MLTVEWLRKKTKKRKGESVKRKKKVVCATCAQNALLNSQENLMKMNLFTFYRESHSIAHKKAPPPD